MKHTMKGCAIALGIVIAGALQATAQEFKTDESISSQLKNGTAPGLKFSPAPARSARAAKAAVDPNEGKETQATQMRKGTLKGANYAGGGGAMRTTQRFTKSAARVQAGSKLPSDEKATIKQPIAPVQPGVVPNQSGPTEVKDSKTTLPAKPTPRAAQ